MSSPSSQPPPTPPQALGNGDSPLKEKEQLTQTPLKEAADLIETLDIACAEMNNCAEDAARDAETARKNARAASEIARRYLHRSYPKAQSPFGFASGASTSSPRRTRPILDINTESKEESLDDISAIASELETPRQNYSFLNLERRKGKRTYKTPTSIERIAQSHADDVLALSIELERGKQTLKSEQRMHQQTKASLKASEAKNKELQIQNDAFQEIVDSSGQEGNQRTQELEEKLARSNLRLEAAEEDAELALDLAKDSAEKRDEMEEMMQTALDELQILRATTKAPDTPKRSVRFADSTPPPPPPPPRPTPEPSSASPRSSTPRAMVAAGRQLLRRSTGTPDQEVITLELTPAVSAERRRRLRERLMQVDGDGIPTPRRLPSTPLPEPPAIKQKIVLDDSKGIAKILQDSGKRLDLGGHWWRKDYDKASTPPTQDIHLEAMARQYCQSVEVRNKRFLAFFLNNDSATDNNVLSRVNTVQN
jgi:hypothetical protein